MDFTKPPQIQLNQKVTMDDFQKALEEVKPQFGIESEKLEILLRNKLIDYGDDFKRIIDVLKSSVE